MQKRITLLSGIAVGIYALELLIPKPLPWLRLGLSNSVVLCAVVMFGFKQALLVSVLRTLVGSLMTGTFLTPFFFFGFLGGVASTCVMWIAYVVGARVFSLIGISILGALAHNTAQLLLAYLVYIKRAELFYLLPFFVLLSLVTGVITGGGAMYLRKILEPTFKPVP